MSTLGNLPVIFTRDEWENSFLSVARMTGSIRVYQREYVIVNENGEDLWLLSKQKKERFLIPQGQVADLIDRVYQPYYQELGRELFFECLKNNMSVNAIRILSQSFKRSDRPQTQETQQGL